MAKDSNSVIICAALTGAATMKNNNPSVPYTIQEFAEEAYKCRQAGAAMVHVHARMEDGQPTHEIAWILRASARSLAVTLPPASWVLSRMATRL